NANPAIVAEVDSNAVDPIEVNSTALVDNLNADLLDGLQASAFVVDGAAAGGALSGTYPNPDLAPAEAWTQVTAFPLDRWANEGSFGTTAAFYQDPFGVVHLKGRVKAEVAIGSSATGIFVLPVGYAPEKNWQYAQLRSNGDTGCVQIAPSGIVSTCTSLRPGYAVGEWLTLDGITFRVAD
ncbi:MAG: hypothetical protein ACRDI2_12030, partial [Chloroflexota bacterium]